MPDLPPISHAPLAMNTGRKRISWDRLEAWRKEVRRSGQRLVVTNGCFDIIHVGHVTYLESARALGDLLLVGLNSDASVRQLKGPSRPINPEEDRATVIAALESVDGVCLFEARSAREFLEKARPDVYVKGGDYRPETLDPAEREAVEAGGGEIKILPEVPGKSTTALVEKLGPGDR